ARTPPPDQLPAHYWQRPRQGTHCVFRDERRASARRRHHYRSFGNRGARGHTLRHASARALRIDGHVPGFLWHVQHKGRGGCARCFSRQGAGILCMTEDTPDQAPVAEKPPENAAVVGSLALPPEELHKLTDDIVA